MSSDDAALHDLIGPHARRDPDRAALVHEKRTWTYGELAAAATAFGARLHAAGAAGGRVALMLPNSPATVVGYLACFAAGAVATPLNSRFAPPEIERALRRARPSWLVVHASRLPLLDRVDPAVLAGVQQVVVSDGEVPTGPAATTALPVPGADAPAVMFFTSGSTGTPKGVVHSQRSALAMLASTSEAMGDVGPADVTQVCEPQVHVSGFIGTLTTLRGGGTVALHDGFDLDTYVDGLLTHRPTLVCTHIDLLAQVVRDPRATADRFASLRGVYTGGDTVPAALQRDFLAIAGRPIAVGYGMTEAIWLTIQRAPRTDRDGCIGVPVGGARLRTDAATGEILVRGPMLMTGYWDDEVLTRDSLTDGWLHTGDLGEADADGVWWFRGRLKDIIVRRTSKITPGEVESAIDEHPDVAACAVVAAPDAEEGQVPVAFVVPRPGRRLSADDLTEFLTGRIAAYKIPARIHFRDALPLTGSGKVAHHDLHEPRE
ncbi:class I adenylate-forming enzyme family protein [Pseudonocardia sp. N23]|uniref:class I adenylate-forming enzyme family protein n=1 Tax=Pseudonocardia sp. N23 TaxID=1987376 RepID=UPI000C025C65|nr:class I adenylate-forming enzyme family protein [Pseudonocardia sp. N23]GAY12394.1 long-chain-fatty-acid--CoA ligase [Pseudonocardia sp. N23]